MEKFPEEKRRIRHSVVWMAFRRKFLRFSRMTRIFTDQLIKTMVHGSKLTSMHRLRGLFKEADLKKSGYLSHDELMSVLRSFGFSAPPDVLEVRVRPPLFVVSTVL